MDKQNFPPLEPENSIPAFLPDIPEQMDLLEESPVIQELTFEAVSEPEQNAESPSAEEDVSPVPQEIPDEALLPSTPEPEETPEAVAEEPVPPAQEAPFFVLPETGAEIQANEQAMDAQGLLEHGQEEPPFDMSLLEHPELMETPEPVIPEESADLEYQVQDQEFDAMMRKAPPEPEKIPHGTSIMDSKGRPKRKKGEGLLGIPSILATFVWLALIVMIGVTAGRMLWICAADVLAFGREDKVVTVTVYEADTMEDIIEKLHQGGLIRYKSLFSLYANISDAEEDIKPGIYDLNTRYDYHALVNFMSPRSSREVIKLTIPEGYTCRQIFSLLEENRICTAVDVGAYAANGELSEYWFLEGLERGTENCLEGYLFPDTYEFYKNSTPREALERMLDNFDYRFDEEMYAQLETLNKKVTDGSYGIKEVVIIASLIEKESAAPAESPKVAGVIYNRLFDWGSNPPYLNIDASIVYAQEGNNDQIDTSLDDPYNTYLYEGLTPGPIANPGLASLKAALNPESHNYYYYVLNPATGMHQFSTTYQEHTGYVRQFAEATED